MRCRSAGAAHESLPIHRSADRIVEELLSRQKVCWPKCRVLSQPLPYVSAHVAMLDLRGEIGSRNKPIGVVRPNLVH
jgi:hypothetical protein